MAPQQPPTDPPEAADAPAPDRSDREDDTAWEHEAERRRQLRVEGSGVGASNSALATAWPVAAVLYAAALVLRDGVFAPSTRLVLAMAAAWVTWALLARAEALPSGMRVPARVCIAAALPSLLLVFGLERNVGPWAWILAGTGLALAAVAGTDAILRVQGLGGLAPARKPDPERLARILGIAWGPVWALAMWGGPPNPSSFDPTTGWSSWLGPLGAVVATATWAAVFAHATSPDRLGANERRVVFLVTTPVASIALAAIQPSPLVAMAGAVASAALMGCLPRDPVRVLVWLEKSVVVAVGVGAVVGLWSLALRGLVTGAVATLAATLSGLAIGPVVGPVSRALRGATHWETKLRRSLVEARMAALGTDVGELRRGVLRAVRALADVPVEASPELRFEISPRLYTFAPLVEYRLGMAGEVLARDPVTGEIEPRPDPDAPAPLGRVLPPGLLELLASEALGVVRRDVLEVLEVRRPDLRGCLAWMRDREAAAIVALPSNEGLEGMLVVPNVPDTRAIGLAMARALYGIAGLFAQQIGLDAALLRARLRAERAEERLLAVEHQYALSRHREAQARSALARNVPGHYLGSPLGSRGYAPTSRAILAELEARARQRGPWLIVHAAGTNVLPWVAHLHRAAGRAGGFVVLDASRDTSWDGERSPLLAAQHGTLVVLTAQVLTAEGSRALVAALEGRTVAVDATPLDVAVVLAVTEPSKLSDGFDRGAPGDLPPISDSTRSALGPLGELIRSTPIRIPPLRERIEDLRALCLERLAALGTARSGDPIGLADDALAIMVEHPWLGDDAELEAVLTIASGLTTSGRVEGRHVSMAMGRVPIELS